MTDLKRITELTLKTVSGAELTEAEQAELDAFLDASPDNRRRFAERISKQQVLRGLEGFANGEHTEDASWERVSKTVAVERAAGVGESSPDAFSPREKPRLPRRRNHSLLLLWRPFTAVAALILVLAGGWLLWRASHTTTPTPVSLTPVLAQSDVQPGGNKAILTLANGRQIALSDAGIGELAQQGEARILKKDSGALSYLDHSGKQNAASSLLYNTLTTPPAGTFMIHLPDGSSVWLNASSSLKYPTSFRGLTSREVSLTGEAYFEVAKLANLPFRVRVDNTVIDVLGTSFNIMAYTDEPALRTTLLDGAVSITRSQQRVVLKPGEEAAARPGNDNLQISKADVDAAIAWKNGFFSFNHAGLQEVMRQLGRWYGVEVAYQGGIIPQRNFYGLIDRQLTLGQALKVLTRNNIHYSIEGKRLLITP